MFLLGIILGESKLDWGQWLYGLMAGFIGGGSSAVVSGVTINMMDPGHFNARNKDFYILVFAMFAANGLMSMFMFLKQNPLPSYRSVTSKTVTIEKQVIGGTGDGSSSPTEPEKP